MSLGFSFLLCEVGCCFPNSAPSAEVRPFANLASTFLGAMEGH